MREGQEGLREEMTTVVEISKRKRGQFEKRKIDHVITSFQTEPQVNELAHHTLSMWVATDTSSESPTLVVAWPSLQHLERPKYFLNLWVSSKRGKRRGVK